MSNVDYQVKDNIAYITLNRPEKMNALTLEMFEELKAISHRVNEDRNAWVAILSGTGRAFCTGIDLTKEQGQQVNVDEVYLSLLDIRKPVLAAVHGFCLAQGAGLAFCSDVRIAAEGTKFGWPQATRGMISISGTCLAAHHLPLNYALQFLYTGELFEAQEAYRLTLVNQVVPQDKLMSTVEDMARKIASNAPLAVQAMKEVSLAGLEMPLPVRLRYAVTIQNRVKQSKDFHEGIKAFTEKRKPQWTGE